MLALDPCLVTLYPHFAFQCHSQNTWHWHGSSSSSSSSSSSYSYSSSVSSVTPKEKIHRVISMASCLGKFVLLINVVFVLCFGAASASQGLTLRRQASILVSLKQGFESPSPVLDNWNLSNHRFLCSWTGVQCDGDHGNYVVSLDISNLGLSGSFSSAITQLVSLRNLSIAGNNFSCPFPPEIHKIPGLQSLNISNNLFNGTLSWEFSLLKELQTLDAYDNGFQGSLPSGVIQLKKLQYLDLGGNYFSGGIPKSYGTMRGLSYLSLAGNDLNGLIPAELGNLTNLTKLRLGYFNSFDGGIPAELGNLVKLVFLDLANCGLKGPIPPKLGNLNQLETLFLQFNQLSGTLPPHLGNLTRLKALDVSNNGLTGEIPPEFSSLKNLTVMNLFMNKFHGGIPAFVAEMQNLQVLQLWENNFTGSIPSKLGQNAELVELDLSTNKLTGLVPESLCFGRKLKILILLKNFLFGHLPDDLDRCDSLVRVRLGQNYLSGSLPVGFVYLPQLSLLELHDNYLTGRIEDANASKQTSNLTQLNLSDNQFSGPLPASIGQLKNSVKLDFSRNNFSGQIPSEIANCLLLTSLDLSQNQLSGPIPVQISHVHVLNYLNVSWNHLNQSLPKEIGSMKSLTSADFSHNNFSGVIPQTGQYLLFNYTSFLGNPLLCGSSLKSCNQTTGLGLGNNADHHHKSFIKALSGKFKLVLALVLFVCSLIFVVMAFIKTRKWRSNANSWKLTAFQKLSFNSEDILECLKDNNIIGKGGAGIVYSGITPNGEQIAVKKLLGIGSNRFGSSHHDHGLSAEIQTLGRIRHRNIVRLLAFCSNRETNLLVYEYMPNGSLGEIVHGKRGGTLKWDTRLKIAIEAAKGLCYLHHDCSPLIVHRDVKSNNILLDSDFEAHVADFGLAKFLNANNGASECMSAIAGSYGYIAPEYAYTLKVDEKSDVYSFGVVLLELLTGKRPVGDFGEEGLDIVQWTKIQTNCKKERVVNVIDQRLQDVPVGEAMQLFFVAMLCVQEQSVERPTMREVVQMLAEAKQPNTFHMQ